jgi:hypothetical protein
MTIKKVVSKLVKTSTSTSTSTKTNTNTNTNTNTSTDKPRGKKDVFEILDGQVKIYSTNSNVF